MQIACAGCMMSPPLFSASWLARSWHGAEVLQEYGQPVLAVLVNSKLPHCAQAILC